jgi:hypothetical protein
VQRQPPTDRGGKRSARPPLLATRRPATPRPCSIGRYRASLYRDVMRGTKCLEASCQ